MPMRAVVSGVAVLAVLCGCLPPPPPPAAGRPLENQYEDELVFSDIPIPRYFAYDPRESFKKVILDKGNVRIARLVYRGAAHVNDVVRFYDDHMTIPEFGWRKVREEIVRGTGAQLLVFQKTPAPDRAPEECKITVHRERGATVIVLEIQ